MKILEQVYEWYFYDFMDLTDEQAAIWMLAWWTLLIACGMVFW